MHSSSGQQHQSDGYHARLQCFQPGISLGEKYAPGWIGLYAATGLDSRSRRMSYGARGIAGVLSWVNTRRWRTDRGLLSNHWQGGGARREFREPAVARAGGIALRRGMDRHCDQPAAAKL